MKRAIRATFLILLVSMLLSAPDALAIDLCLVCKGVVGGGGSLYVYCAQVSSGGMGARYCFVEDDGSGGAYCHTEGDWCCGTGY